MALWIFSNNRSYSEGTAGGLLRLEARKAHRVDLPAGRFYNFLYRFDLKKIFAKTAPKPPGQGIPCKNGWKKPPARR